jgi:type I restriction enzyme, S subunit
MLDKARPFSGQRLRYLRNINVRWGSIDLSDLLEMPFEPDELDRYGICHNDLLICEGGEPGRCSVWRYGPTDLKFQKALHRVRVRAGIEPEFLRYQLQLDAANGRLARYFTGSTIKHFTGESLARYPLRLAPLGEQRRIVEKIDELFSQIEAGERALEQALRLLQRSFVVGEVGQSNRAGSILRQSVLSTAFSGRLVPQDPADEPASVLLDRVRAERATLPGAAKRRGRRPVMRP